MANNQSYAQYYILAINCKFTTLYTNVVPGVEDVLHFGYLACEHSSGPPVPSSWFEQEPAPAEPHKMNTLVEEIFSISSTKSCVYWCSSASDCPYWSIWISTNFPLALLGWYEVFACLLQTLYSIAGLLRSTISKVMTHRSTDRHKYSSFLL